MRVKLPISGWVKMREEVRFAGRILSVTISRQADAWYASFSIEVAYEPEVRTDASVVGVDLGITAKTHDETDALPNGGSRGSERGRVLANQHLSRAIADVGFFEFRRQLDYKAA
jgi:transposase